MRNSDHSISPRCSSEPGGFRTIYDVMIQAKLITGRMLLDGVIISRAYEYTSDFLLSVFRKIVSKIAIVSASSSSGSIKVLMPYML